MLSTLVILLLTPSVSAVVVWTRPGHMLPGRATARGETSDVLRVDVREEVARLHTELMR